MCGANGVVSCSFPAPPPSPTPYPWPWNNCSCYDDEVCRRISGDKDGFCEKFDTCGGGAFMWINPKCKTNYQPKWFKWSSTCYGVPTNVGDITLA